MANELHCKPAKDLDEALVECKAFAKRGHTLANDAVSLDKLEVALREKRYAEATQIVHKVKSSSGSIGAKSLQDVAALLQKALNEEKEDEIVPLQDRFSKLLGKLLEEL